MLIPFEMKSNINEGIKILNKAENTILIYHDDADGVCSAALAILGLEKLKVKVKRRICLEKLFPEAIKIIHRDLSENDVVVYVDLGSPHADKIAKEVGKEKVIIIDHHDPKRIRKNNIIHVNPELYGLTGERDASASTMTYLFFKTAAPELRYYSFLAVIGSAEIPGPLTSLNSIPLNDAETIDKVRVFRSMKTVKYYVDFYGLRKPHAALSSMLSTIASIGYYVNGPEKAVRSCVEGFSENTLKLYNEMKQVKNELFKKAFDKIYAHGLRKTKYVQWFNLGKLFYNIGVKSIGLFTSQLKYRRIIDQDKYILGFMLMNPKIPGLGELKDNLAKVSGRVPLRLGEKIKVGEMPGIGEVMVEAAERVNGFADGHTVAASGVIEEKRIEQFIEEFVKIVDRKIKQKGLFKYFIK